MRNASPRSRRLSVAGGNPLYKFSRHAAVRLRETMKMEAFCTLNQIRPLFSEQDRGRSAQVGPYSTTGAGWRDEFDDARDFSAGPGGPSAGGGGGVGGEGGL